MARYWVAVDRIADGENQFTRSADDGNLEQAVAAEAARWSPAHVVTVVPFGGATPIRTERCTGVVTGMS